MSKIDNGGPAFPIPLHPGQTYTAHALCDGMTLRDYFAAKVMQGMYNDGTVAQASKLVDDSKNMDAVSQWAYAQADAMLRAREANQ